MKQSKKRENKDILTYLMVNTIADPDDIKERVQNIVTNAFCTCRGNSRAKERVKREGKRE
jgi:hypothetical protein